MFTYKIRKKIKNSEEGLFKYLKIITEKSGTDAKERMADNDVP